MIMILTQTSDIVYAAYVDINVFVRKWIKYVLVITYATFPFFSVALNE